MKFTKQQKSILVGTILGDAYLQKTGKNNARLRLEQGDKQKAYLFWKVKQFPKLFQGKPHYLERKHPITGKIYKYWRHQSNSTPELGKWQRLFYADGKKHIPVNLSKFLTDTIGLAIWYMDDGYYYDRDKVSYLYLGRIKRDEAEVAKITIEKDFAISCLILDKKQKGFVLYFPPGETIKFHRKVEKFMLPLFSYKLSKTLTNLLDPVTTDPFKGESQANPGSNAVSSPLFHKRAG